MNGWQATLAVVTMCLLVFCLQPAKSDCSGVPCPTCTSGSYSGGQCGSLGPTCMTNPCYSVSSTPDNCTAVNYTCPTGKFRANNCNFMCNGSNWQRVGSACGTGQVCLDCIANCELCTASTGCGRCVTQYTFNTGACRAPCSGDPADPITGHTTSTGGGCDTVGGSLHNAVCTVACQGGYVPSGSYRCNDGGWTAQSGPNCVQATCSGSITVNAPVTVGNCGARSQGGSCLLGCQAGFSVSGTQSITCQADAGPTASFNPAGPYSSPSSLITCTACTGTRSATNCAGWTTNTCTCTSCNTGYTLGVGECTPCTNPQCSSYSAGNCICASCNGGYTLTGNSCNPSACFGDPATASNRNSPSVTGNNCNYISQGSGVPHGTPCSLACILGYTPASSPTFICNFGNWELVGGSTQPTCNPSACASAAPLAAVGATASGGCAAGTSHGGVCTFSCSAGQAFPFPANNMTCLFGNWKYSDVNYCADINECATQPGPCGPGDECINLIRTGYSCGDAPCNQLPSPGAAIPGGSGHAPGDSRCGNSGSFPTVPTGTSCALACLAGFTASGSYQCNRNTWGSVGNPTCSPNNCFTDPRGGVAASTGITGNNCVIGGIGTPSMQVCTLLCASGFRPVGSYSCYASAWTASSGPAPACLANPCVGNPVTAAVPHGVTIQSTAQCSTAATESGETCNLVCETGYTASGGFRCQATNWQPTSGPAPSCAANPCTASPVAVTPNSNAMLLCNPTNSVSGTSGCKANCSEGYNSTGTWFCLAAAWRGDAACDDINECAVLNGGCPEACGNTPGSFTCFSPASGNNAGAAAGAAIGVIFGLGALGAALYFGRRYQRKKELEINEKRLELDTVITDAPVRPWGTVSAPAGNSSAAAAHKDSGGAKLAAAGAPRKYTGPPGRVPTSLRDLLTSPKATTAFEHFLASEYSSENLQFYLAVENYRNQKHNLERTATMSAIQISQALRVDTDRIHTEFFGRDIGSKNVNVPTEVGARLDNFVNQYNATGKAQQYVPRDSEFSAGMSSSPKKSVTVFDEAQEVVYSLMEADSFGRFLKSSIWSKARAHGAMNDAEASSTPAPAPASTSTAAPAAATPAAPAVAAAPSTTAPLMKAGSSKQLSGLGWAGAGGAAANPAYTSSSYQAFTAVAPAVVPAPATPAKAAPVPAPAAAPTPAPPALPPKTPTANKPTPAVMPSPAAFAPKPPAVDTPPPPPAEDDDEDDKPAPPAAPVTAKPAVVTPAPPAPAATPKAVVAPPPTPAPPAPAALSVSNAPRVARAGSGSTPVPVPPPPAPPGMAGGATTSINNPARTARAGSGSTPVPPPPPAPTTSAPAGSPRVVRAGSGSTPVVPPPPPPAATDPPAAPKVPPSPAAAAVSNPPRVARAGSGSTPVPVPPPPAPPASTPIAVPPPPAPVAAPPSTPTKLVAAGAGVPAKAPATPAPPAPPAPGLARAGSNGAPPPASPRSVSPAKPAVALGASSLNKPSVAAPSPPVPAAPLAASSSPRSASPAKPPGLPTAAGASSAAAPPSPVRQFSAPRAAAGAGAGAGSLNRAGSSTNVVRQATTGASSGVSPARPASPGPRSAAV